jgi:transposase
MYYVTLTEDERGELNRRSHERSIAPRTRDRLEMVRLCDAGWSVPRIAGHMGEHGETVRFWIKEFLGKGFDGLEHKPPVGQTSKLTAAMVVVLREEIGKGTRTWTAGQAAQWVSERFGVTLSPGRMSVHIKRAGLSRQRSGPDLKHKQKPLEVAEKQATLQMLEKGGTRA